MIVRRLAAVPVLLAALAAGCGGEKSDVSGGVNAINQELAQQGARLDCPKEVDGGEGATFECDLEGTQTNKSTKIEMKIVKENGDLAVDFAGTRAQVQAAIRRVTTG
ncbi:MAG TPA: hypothetical protein VNB64_00690 [Solirubrobacteraceae bacterium]|nr:hypothetical protein [Solirubrobacteraceae bacterium]